MKIKVGIEKYVDEVTQDEPSHQIIEIDYDGWELLPALDEFRYTYDIPAIYVKINDTIVWRRGDATDRSFNDYIWDLEQEDII